MKKVVTILINCVPVLLMIGLIPLVANDYLLTAVYVAVIVASFLVRKERNEYKIFIAGFVLMIISEYLFISTGVETFTRNSLLGLMPLWLPFLWGYGFVVISRIVRTI